MINDNDIRALRREARAASDYMMSDICDIALASREDACDDGTPLIGPDGQPTTRTEARRECARVLRASKTIANRILDDLLCGDGCARRTRLGIDRARLADRIGRRMRDRLGNTVGWEFADGSEIIESGGGWDTPEGWDDAR